MATAWTHSGTSSCSRSCSTTMPGRHQLERPALALCPNRKLRGRAAGQYRQELLDLQPTVGFILGKQNGRELSAFAGVDFNTTNGATDYKTGTQAHVEVTAAQHLPLAGGLAGAGLHRVLVQPRCAADSGAGATLGPPGTHRRPGPGRILRLQARGHNILAEARVAGRGFHVRRPFQGGTVFLNSSLKSLNSLLRSSGRAVARGGCISSAGHCLGRSYCWARSSRFCCCVHAAAPIRPVMQPR